MDQHASQTEKAAREKGDAAPTQKLEHVVIRFAGDSGDGMQLTGNRFTTEAALYGNDIRTLPDFPAEIRAPAGTLAGVSSFQLNFAREPVFTPGDAVDVLVAMNPAALKVHLGDLRSGGILIVNTGQFTKRNLEKAGYAHDPLEQAELQEAYRLVCVDISKLTDSALADLGLPPRTVERCKNFFALGLTFWLYSRPLENTLKYLDEKFGKDPQLAEANKKALKAGYFYGETAEVFQERYAVEPAAISPGTYRNVSGNKALAFGLLAASERSGMPLFLGSYPITPASDILHELSSYKQFGVRTFQAEDEIAAVTAAIGASFGGALGVTSTSGPGVALKAEALGLAHMVELPLVVIDVQRAGPSTGMPTKTEQADLLQAMYGRNSEAPMPVLAASSPADCFATAYEAVRIALKYMTPVVLLSDGYVANGSEPWRLPDVSTLPSIDVQWRENTEGFAPYVREPQTLARPRVWLGTPGLEHRIGGLEKQHEDGSVSYDPENHELMVRMRAEKVRRVQQDIPPTRVHGDPSGEVLLLGWGGTFGSIYGATRRLRNAGRSVSCVHLRHLHPLPADLPEVLSRFERVLLPELNQGQLARILRAETLVDVQSIQKIRGQPFKEEEIVAKVIEHMSGNGDVSPFLSPTLEGVLAELGTAPSATGPAQQQASTQQAKAG